jgi:hypothetical protein
MSRLPLPIQREVEERLAAAGFGGYVALQDDLRRRGYRISKSALHRFGKELKAIQAEADRQALLNRAKARARKAAT